MKQPARHKACSRGRGGPPATTRILTHCHVGSIQRGRITLEIIFPYVPSSVCVFGKDSDQMLQTPLLCSGFGIWSAPCKLRNSIAGSPATCSPVAVRRSHYPPRNKHTDLQNKPCVVESNSGSTDKIMPTFIPHRRHLRAIRAVRWALRSHRVCASVAGGGDPGRRLCGC